MGKNYDVKCQISSPKTEKTVEIWKKKTITSQWRQKNTKEYKRKSESLEAKKVWVKALFYI